VGRKSRAKVAQATYEESALEQDADATALLPPKWDQLRVFFIEKPEGPEIKRAPGLPSMARLFETISSRSAHTIEKA
jgi:hypothetical protein